MYYSTTGEFIEKEVINYLDPTKITSKKYRKMWKKS